MGSLLDQIINPGQINTSGVKSSKLLSAIKKPTERDLKIYNLQKEGAQATLEAQQANSFKGLFKETLRGLPETAGITDVISSIKQDLFNVKTTLPKSPKSVLGFLFSPTSINDPQKFLDAAIPVFKESFNAEKEAINKLLTTKPGTAERGGAVASTLARTASLAISPISALFSASETIPVLGTAVKAMNAAFGVAGKGGTIISDKIIDSLPISDEAKNHLKPGIGEIASLAAQITLGKAGEVGGKKVTELTKKYGKEDAQFIVQKAKEIAQAPTPTAPTAPTAPTGRLLDRIIKPEGVSQTAVKTVERAKQAGLISEKPELPRVETMKMDVQAERAKELIRTNPEEALRQIKDTTLPETYKGSIYKELEAKAIAEGDVSTILELSKSKVGTEAGQALKAFDAGLEIIENPVKLIREIEKARQESPVVKGILRTGNIEKAKVQTKAKIVEEIKKTSEIKPKTWEDFISSLQC